ncbi:MAG: PhnD/SsuA/transferrin family substrate-binding protein [Rubrivivax sp.]|nr:PhnD/SsuA/transferrin family substrate-binding protein [Rubrivivax sp.]
MKTASILPAGLAVLLALTAPVVQAFTFVVNEGVTYRVGNDEIRARYAPIAADLTKLLGQPIRVEPVADYPTLRKGLADKSYDLALVHPAHIAIGAMKHSGYRLVAVTKGFEKYSAAFMVRADAPFKSLSELRGRKVGAPDEDSITSWLVRATMRDALGDAQAVTYTYTRYQDAVPFMVEHTFTQTGASASTAVIKQWEASGGKVLARSRPVPIKQLIAGPQVSDEQLEKLREYFISLDSTEAGRKKLEPIKVKGYAAYDVPSLLAMGTWLGIAPTP